MVLQAEWSESATVPPREESTNAHTAKTPPATRPISSAAWWGEKGVRNKRRSTGSGNAGLTMRAMVVSVLSPTRKRETAIEPTIPSRFSMKKPGCMILHRQPLVSGRNGVVCTAAVAELTSN